MAIWIVMLIVQPFLVKYKKLSYHRLIGKLNYFVVPLVVLSSFFMIRFSYYKEVEAARQQAPGVTLDTWLRMAADNTAIPFFCLGWFAVFYLLAVRNKRKSAIHARYMMATALTMLGPTVDRILVFHFNLFESVGNWLFAITFLLIDPILLRQLILKLQQHPVDFSILSQAIKRQRITEEITEAYQHALHSGDSIHFSSEEQAAAQTLGYHLMLAAALLPNSHQSAIFCAFSHY